MTKAELINAMADKSGMSRKDAETSLTAVIDIITETLAKGEKIQLVGFGSFEVRTRAEREGINPQTQKKITIAATKVPAFKAGKALKDAVSD